MLLFLALCALIYWGGALINWPMRLRLFLIAGVVYPAFLIAAWLIPEEARFFSGTLLHWLVGGGAALLILLYVLGIKRLRAKAETAPEPAPKSGFREAELERYARHIVMREIGGAGQKKLSKARVLVIGAGGLGAPALQYLAGAGVGLIGVIDDDIVSNSNLQRQVIHPDAAIGSAKVHSAKAAMLALNPFISVQAYNRKFTAEIGAELLADYDIVLDGSDNFETRYAANAVCVAAGKPLISGALSQWEGQISLFHPASETPCYQCIFPQAPAEGLAPSCAEGGVLGPLPGVIGAMMAVETVKAITGAGTGLGGRMMIYDALYGETRTIALKSRPDCPICAAKP
ncbi:MAG: molybdopterin/thiamine biosynthesis adenylyltransferase [Halocynthiibacter sp.]|jgi:molybdopterin/thiamine biosynthesis adenylyltransferase